MAKKKVCDLCGGEVLKNFSDRAYKITVKELNNCYDGYAPWVSKTKIDVCDICMGAAIEIAHQRRN